MIANSAFLRKQRVKKYIPVTKKRKDFFTFESFKGKYNRICYRGMV